MRIGLLEREERMRDVKLHKGLVFEGEGERKDETLRINRNRNNRKYLPRSIK